MMSGGSSETELNELMVTPSAVPSAVIVVTTVTPVAKRASASRKSRCAESYSAGGRSASSAGCGRPGGADGGQYAVIVRTCGRRAGPQRQQHSGSNRAGSTGSALCCSGSRSAFSLVWAADYRCPADYCRDDSCLATDACHLSGMVMTPLRLPAITRGVGQPWPKPPFSGVARASHLLA